jgi:hypothetical protein
MDTRSLYDMPVYAGHVFGQLALEVATFIRLF